MQRMGSVWTHVLYRPIMEAWQEAVLKRSTSGVAQGWVGVAAGPRVGITVAGVAVGAIDGLTDAVGLPVGAGEVGAVVGAAVVGADVEGSAVGPAVLGVADGDGVGAEVGANWHCPPAQQPFHCSWLITVPLTRASA